MRGGWRGLEEGLEGGLKMGWKGLEDGFMLGLRGGGGRERVLKDGLEGVRRWVKGGCVVERRLVGCVSERGIRGVGVRI